MNAIRNNCLLILAACIFAGCSTSRFTLAAPEKKITATTSERALYIKSNENRPCDDYYYFRLDSGKFHKTKIPIRCGEESQ